MSEYADLIFIIKLYFYSHRGNTFLWIYCYQKRPDTFYRKRIGSY